MRADPVGIRIRAQQIPARRQPGLDLCEDHTRSDPREEEEEADKSNP